MLLFIGRSRYLTYLQYCCTITLSSTFCVCLCNFPQIFKVIYIKLSQHIVIYDGCWRVSHHFTRSSAVNAEQTRTQSEVQTALVSRLALEWGPQAAVIASRAALDYTPGRFPPSGTGLAGIQQSGLFVEKRRGRGSSLVVSSWHLGNLYWAGRFPWPMAPWHCWNAFENMPWKWAKIQGQFFPLFWIACLRKHSWETAGWSVAPWGQGTWEADVNAVVLDDGGLKRASFLHAESLVYAGWHVREDRLQCVLACPVKMMNGSEPPCPKEPETLVVLWHSVVPMR